MAFLAWRGEHSSGAKKYAPRERDCFVTSSRWGEVARDSARVRGRRQCAIVRSVPLHPPRTFGARLPLPTAESPRRGERSEARTRRKRGGRSPSHRAAARRGRPFPLRGAGSRKRPATSQQRRKSLSSVSGSARSIRQFRGRLLPQLVQMVPNGSAHNETGGM